NAFPERHLGLRTANDEALPASRVAHWGARAEEWLGVDAILQIARCAPALEIAGEREAPRAATRVRTPLAPDDALHFYYEDSLRRLEAAGAELVRFSVVNDARLPADVYGVYLGGGYPEAHARAIAANESMRASIASFAGPIYGECGGLMVLARS